MNSLENSGAKMAFTPFGKSNQVVLFLALGDSLEAILMVNRKNPHKKIISPIIRSN